MTYSRNDRRPVMAVMAVMAALALTAPAGCAHAPAGDAALTVLHVEAARFDPAHADREPALREACAAWRLSERQVAAFFAAAREYSDGTNDTYYWLPCSIQGRLRAQGREWTFEINAAATASWRDGDTVRRWGCDARACEPLVLLMRDDNAQ